MLALRADPWAPDHGMGFEVRFEETPASADPSVETEDWSRPLAPPPAPPQTVWFVDGVRRVELRVIADEDGRRAPGLFGSWAVGSVRCDGRAAFAEHRIGRAVVLGGGFATEPIRIPVGDEHLSYEPASEPGTDPDTPLFGLQRGMQRAEAQLAARIAGSGEGVVLVDGRLGFLDPTASPVVGVVKRFVRAYLDPEHDALLTALAPGERTPLFGLVYEGQPLARFAWYARLVVSRRAWHDHAGLVRCEVSAGIGLEEARALADRVSAMLPGFAGRPSDPRYPQNLVPVAGLEGWLQHRMGHRGLIRRGLTAWLTGHGAPGGRDREG
ncbi:MAG TPA: hypothetical protein VE669_12340 [Actinomycetota bacterium]|nr:hypothetical protein [Actinomycetota bacterium]